jgi:DNA-binding transcriptional regulator YhcF (GntR family)
MLDDRSPIYRQIADRIRDEVLAGALGPDDAVMSTNQYAAFYGINPATVAKAFHELIAEGVIYKRRGVGMFVAADAAERLRAERRTSFFSEDLDPVLTRARVLGIPVESIVEHIRSQPPEAPQLARETGAPDRADSDLATPTPRTTGATP